MRAAFQGTTGARSRRLREVISAVTQSYVFREHLAIEGDSLESMVQ